tara:strand:- start:33 stop:314 length:282 start_codon:yes stop_codon:yes gene_type:complete
MTVRELLCRIDSKELSEWASYFSMEPFGNTRSDIQAGIIASTIANCNRTKSSQKLFNATDFMPIGEHNKTKPIEQEEKIKNIFKKMATIEESK